MTGWTLDAAQILTSKINPFSNNYIITRRSTVGLGSVCPRKWSVGFSALGPALWTGTAHTKHPTQQIYDSTAAHENQEDKEHSIRAQPIISTRLSYNCSIRSMELSPASRASRIFSRKQRSLSCSSLRFKSQFAFHRQRSSFFAGVTSGAGVCFLINVCSGWNSADCRSTKPNRIRFCLGRLLRCNNPALP